MPKTSPENRINLRAAELTQKQVHVLEEYRRVLENQAAFVQRYASQYESLSPEEQTHADERAAELSDLRRELWDRAKGVGISKFQLQIINFEFMSPEVREAIWHEIFHEGPDISPADFYALAEMYDISLETNSDSQQ